MGPGPDGSHGHGPRPAGFATWNVEYRRAGPTGGGWPCTLADVADAVEALVRCADRYRLDLARVVVVGHSAGGQLGLLLARDRFSDGASSGGRRVAVRAVVGLAPVCDMLDAERRGLGQGAVAEFLGGSSAEVPDRYRLSSPAAQVPLGVRQLLVHGGADQSVPPDVSERYQELANAAGDEVAMLLALEAGHRDVIEASCPAGRRWPIGSGSSPELGPVRNR